MHPPHLVQAAVVGGHPVGLAAGGGGHLFAVYWLGVQGGRLHPLQGVGALVLAASGGGGGHL